MHGERKENNERVDRRRSVCIVHQTRAHTHTDASNSAQRLIWFHTLSFPRSSVCVFPSASVNNAKRMILNSECSGSRYGSPFPVKRFVYFTLVYNKTEKQAKSTNADECFFLFIFIGLESLFGDAANRTGLLSNYFFNQRNRQLSALDSIVLSLAKP